MSCPAYFRFSVEPTFVACRSKPVPGLSYVSHPTCLGSATQPAPNTCDRLAFGSAAQDSAVLLPDQLSFIGLVAELELAHRLRLELCALRILRAGPIPYFVERHTARRANFPGACTRFTMRGWNIFVCCLAASATSGGTDVPPLKTHLNRGTYARVKVLPESLGPAVREVAVEYCCRAEDENL